VSAVWFGGVPKAVLVLLAATVLVREVVAALDQRAIQQELATTRDTLADRNQQLITANHQLTLTQQQLQDTMTQLEDLTIAHERHRMAREIHDGMGQHLHVTMLLISALRNHATLDLAARTAIQKVVESLAHVQVEMRAAITALTDDPTDASLEAMLVDVIQAAQHYRIRLTQEIVGMPRALPLVTRHAIYRVAQEAVTNMGKHAQATAASLVLDYTDATALTVTIRDNGVGFQTANPLATASPICAPAPRAWADSFGCIRLQQE